MPRRKIARSRRPQAERAAEHWLVEVMGCDPHQMRRAIRTKYQAVDFFASDVMAKDRAGKTFYVQVTAGQNEAVRVRRRKLEKFSWNTHDFVYVLQLVEVPNPVNIRRKDYFFRVHYYDHFHEPCGWIVEGAACPVPREWFKKLQEDVA